MVFLGRIVLFLSIVEAIVFAGVASDIGFFRAAFIEMLFMAGGLVLLQIEGAEVIRLLFTQNRIASGNIFDSLCRVAAGFLFLFPGYVSDVMAAILLVPAIRPYLRKTSFFKTFFTSFSSQQTPQDDGVIEGDYRVLEEENIRIDDGRERQE